jgi:malonate-semialdehyde dehydrogenase (acetylating)/methylmalonate-semialdehyde dehydrogenase
MLNNTNQIGHFIDGKDIFDKGEKIDIFNPSTGQIYGFLCSATKKTINKAIVSSEKAFHSWKDTSITKRTSILFEYKYLLEKKIDKIAELIGEDLGKTFNDAKGEVRRGIENVEYACGIANSIKGEHNKSISTSIDSWSQFEPLGIVLGITPFNFPAMVPMWMFPLAIVAGNAFILKPSDKDPIATLYLAKLFKEAGLPDGVLNVLNGNKDVVNNLLDDNRIKGVSFVGSTPVAKHIYNSAAKNGIRCQALGGAKNHALILPDADVKQTVKQLLGAAYGSSGQRCMALSVAVIVEDIAEKIIKELKKEIQKFKIGLFNKKLNDFGPLVSKEHRKSVIKLIDSAEKEGSKILIDGRKKERRRKRSKKWLFSWSHPN